MSIQAPHRPQPAMVTLLWAALPVLLLILAPAIGPLVPRLLAYLSAVALLGSLPWQTGQLLRATEADGGDGRRRVLSVGSGGAALGAALGIVLLVLLGGTRGGASADGEPGPAAGGSVQDRWLSAVDYVHGQVDGSGGLNRFRATPDDAGGFDSWVTYIDGGGLVYTAGYWDGEWNTPTADAASPWSIRDTFDPAVVTADLDAVSAQVLAQGRRFDQRYGLYEVALERSAAGVIVDSAPNPRITDGQGDALVTLSLGTSDDSSGKTTFEALGDGSLPAELAAPGDLTGGFLRALHLLAAAGVDVQGMELSSYRNWPVSVGIGDDSSLQVRNAAQRVSLDWDTGTFGRLDLGTGYEPHADAIFIAGVDPAALGRAAEDARGRGNLSPLERNLVNAELETTDEGTAVLEVKISDDPAASGNYDFSGNYLGPVED